MTRTAGAFAADTLLGPDLALNAPGLWMVEWYALQRVQGLAGPNAVTYLIRDGATVLYQSVKSITLNPGGPEGSIHRILLATTNATHVAQVETNSGIAAGDSIEVSKGAQLLGTLAETQAIGYVAPITPADLLALRGWW